MTDATQDFDGSSPLSVAGIQYASQHGAYSPSIRVYNVFAGMVIVDMGGLKPKKTTVSGEAASASADRQAACPMPQALESLKQRLLALMSTRVSGLHEP